VEFRLECWGEENLNEYLGPRVHKETRVELPWVVVSSRPQGDIIEFSTSSRAEALAFMLENLIQESYGEWEDGIEAQFGVSHEVIIQCVLKYVLPPDEKKLLSDFYHDGLLFDCEKTKDQTEEHENGSK